MVPVIRHCEIFLQQLLENSMHTAVARSVLRLRAFGYVPTSVTDVYEQGGYLILWLGRPKENDGGKSLQKLQLERLRR